MIPSTDPGHTPEGASLTELILEVFKLNGRLRGIEHDEIVAGAVHLGEMQLHAGIIGVAALRSAAF